MYGKKYSPKHDICSFSQALKVSQSGFGQKCI